MQSKVALIIGLLSQLRTKCIFLHRAIVWDTLSLIGSSESQEAPDDSVSPSRGRFSLSRLGEGASSVFVESACLVFGELSSWTSDDGAS